MAIMDMQIGPFLKGVSASLAVLHVAFPACEARAEEQAVKITYASRCIFLPVRLNDRSELLFLLDTGANVSAIDTRAAESAGLPITGTGRVEGTGGVIDVQRARVSSLAVGALRVKNLNVTVQDLSGSLSPPGVKRIDGILGYDFLRRFSVRIDFVGATAVFSTGPARKAFPEEKDAQAIPFTLDNGIPRIHGVLNGDLKTDFRLDTGASLFDTREVYLNITEGDWKRLQGKDPDLRPESYLTGTGTGGTVKLPVAHIQSLRIGVAMVDKPRVIVQPATGYFARSDAVGFVSNNLLEKYSPIILDYRERKLYLHDVKSH
jgi:hypothetical protein